MLHTAFAVYFIACIAAIYSAAITLHIDLILWLAIASLAVEGIAVFLLNGGHCPLAPLQRKLDDSVPFFNLFLPAPLAKKAIPFFTTVTFLGLAVLIVRFLINR